MSGKTNTGLWVRLGGSVVLAALFLYALTPYFDAVPSSFDIAWWTLPAYAVALLVYNVTRTARWLVLLKPLGTVPLGIGLRVGMAGTMWIALLPFRLGELARPMMLAKTTDITLRRALGSIAIERVVDGLIICGLFFATAAGLPDADASSELSRLRTATTAVMGLFLSALVTLALMGTFPSAARRAVDATLGRVAPRLAPVVADTAQAFSEGLSVLPRGGPLLGFLALTAVYWASNAVGMWILATGCGLPLTLSATVTVMAVINIALLVPGGPAQVGIFQAGVVLGLGLFLSPDHVRAAGSTYVFLLYVCQLGSIVLFGAWAQSTLSINWRAALQRDDDALPSPPTNGSAPTERD